MTDNDNNQPGINNEKQLIIQFYFWFIYIFLLLFNKLLLLSWFLFVFPLLFYLKPFS